MRVAGDIVMSGQLKELTKEAGRSLNRSLSVEVLIAYYNKFFGGNNG
jgi:hypothetical protein